MKKEENKIKVSLNTKKVEQFQKLIEGLIQSGFNDVYLTEGQSEVWLYLPEPSGFNIALNRNGTWELK